MASIHHACGIYRKQHIYSEHDCCHIIGLVICKIDEGTRKGEEFHHHVLNLIIGHEVKMLVAQGRGLGKPREFTDKPSTHFKATYCFSFQHHVGPLREFISITATGVRVASKHKGIHPPKVDELASETSRAPDS
jgi:hypothetical protein